MLHAISGFPEIDINPVDRYGGTPTEDAIREGHDAVERFLVSHGGLRKDSPQLVQKCAERDARQAQRISEGQVTSKKNEVRDTGRDALMKQMESYLSCVDGPLVKLHLLVQILAMTLDPNGASAPRALNHSPNPNLLELLELRAFQSVLYVFAKSVHSESLLEFYIDATKLNTGSSIGSETFSERGSRGSRGSRERKPRSTGASDETTDRNISDLKSAGEDSSTSNESGDGHTVGPPEVKTGAEKQWQAVNDLYKRFLQPGAQQSINANPSESDRVRKWLKSSPDADAALAPSLFQRARRASSNFDPPTLILPPKGSGSQQLDDEPSSATSGSSTQSGSSRSPVKAFHDNDEPAKRSTAVAIAHKLAVQSAGVQTKKVQSESPASTNDHLRSPGAQDRRSLLAPNTRMKRSLVPDQATQDSKESKSGVVFLWGEKTTSAMSGSKVLEPLRAWAGKRLEVDVLCKFYRSSAYREMLKERIGRFWRILRLCESIISHVGTIDQDLLSPLEGTAGQESMMLIYDQPARAHEMAKEVLALTSALRETSIQMGKFALKTAHAAKRLFRKLELRDAASLMAEGDEGEGDWGR